MKVSEQCGIAASKGNKILGLIRPYGSFRQINKFLGNFKSQNMHKFLPMNK